MKKATLLVFLSLYHGFYIPVHVKQVLSVRTERLLIESNDPKDTNIGVKKVDS
jgi:hypothetical protein